MNSGLLNSDQLKAEALRLGFSHCGLAPAEPVDEVVVAHRDEWLREGRQGEMHYLERYSDLRRDPRLLLPGAKTVVSLAMSYNPGANPTQAGLAWYAQGRDYHDVVREYLQHLVSHLSLLAPDYRICVDSAPIMESYWAWRCGLGWIGRHTQLVVPHEGSAFFLSELLLTVEADKYDRPLYDNPFHSGCGSCHRCIDACPTGALSEGGIDARRCLSYLTIEHRGELSESVAPYLRECFYGCDRCMRACPHLSSKATPVPEFRPSSSLLAMSPSSWNALSPEEYQSLFRGSAVKRAKYEGLCRNISLAYGKREEGDSA
ncbi:MAG: tRNA epoxyqueuosine(34) reductase QueG [Bacteroidaceae bacterium]|nr:tRNA epoxyqueuosine(34) reductase QueG [Bacteroidaceae bacterium]